MDPVPKPLHSSPPSSPRPNPPGKPGVSVIDTPSPRTANRILSDRADRPFDAVSTPEQESAARHVVLGGGLPVIGPPAPPPPPGPAPGDGPATPATVPGPPKLTPIQRLARLKAGLPLDPTEASSAPSSSLPPHLKEKMQEIRSVPCSPNLVKRRENHLHPHEVCNVIFDRYLGAKMKDFEDYVRLVGEKRDHFFEMHSQHKLKKDAFNALRRHAEIQKRKALLERMSGLVRAQRAKETMRSAFKIWHQQVRQAAVPTTRSVETQDFLGMLISMKQDMVVGMGEIRQFDILSPKMATEDFERLMTEFCQRSELYADELHRISLLIETDPSQNQDEQRLLEECVDLLGQYARQLDALKRKMIAGMEGGCASAKGVPVSPPASPRGAPPPPASPPPSAPTDPGTVLRRDGGDALSAETVRINRLQAGTLSCPPAPGPMSPPAHHQSASALDTPPRSAARLIPVRRVASVRRIESRPFGRASEGVDLQLRNPLLNRFRRPEALKMIIADLANPHRLCRRQPMKYNFVPEDLAFWIDDLNAIARPGLSPPDLDFVLVVFRTILQMMDRDRSLGVLAKTKLQSFENIIRVLSAFYNLTAEQALITQFREVGSVYMFGRRYFDIQFPTIDSVRLKR